MEPFVYARTTTEYLRSNIELKNCVAWQSKPMKQSVIYDDQSAVEKALRKLEALPPRVTATEVS